MPFGLQPLDLIVIAVVALVIFGPKRLPQLGRWLGKAFSSFRKGARDLADGFAEQTRTQDPDTAGGVASGSAPGGASADPTVSRPGEPAPRLAGASCASCGASNPSGSRFCNQCGTRLPG